MFTGFRPAAIDFLTELRLHNQETFFKANKERYETLVKAPLRALCEEMEPVVRSIDARLDTRPARVMSRIRRDTRFTRDKSPFRDHVWLGWRYPGESRSEGFDMYWGFGPDWLGWGCGLYGPNKPVMDALRLAILREADTVRGVLYAPGLRKRYALYGEDYVRIVVPQDVPQDLRALYVKRYFGIERVTDACDREMLFTREAADSLAQALTAMAPLQQFMQRMRREGEQALREAALEREQREREAAAMANAAERTRHAVVRGVEDFEF